MKAEEKTLRNKRLELVTAQRKIYELAETKKRDITAEERTQYETMDTDLIKVEDRLKVVEAETVADEKRREDLTRRVTELAAVTEKPIETGTAAPATEANEKVSKLFRRYLVSGDRSFTPEDMRVLASGPENRALQADEDIYGGFLRAPRQFSTEFLQAADNETFVRQWAKVIQVTKAESLGVVSLDTDIGDVEWTAEIQTGSEDSDMRFGGRDLFPHPLARRIVVSRKLIRSSVMSVEQLVRERLAYKFGVVMENAYLNGTGSNQPLGVFTVSALGITTDRDVPTGNIDTDIRTDGLIEAKYSLKKQYRNSAKWIFHRDGVKRIRKLKDGEGRYIWQDGIVIDRPATILELPYEESEYVPNTWTSDLYVGMLGDWSFYWIADALDMEIQTLVELKAETNQVEYIGRVESDGLPVLEEAFARVQLA